MLTYFFFFLSQNILEGFFFKSVSWLHFCCLVRLSKVPEEKCKNGNTQNTENKNTQLFFSCSTFPTVALGVSCFDALENDCVLGFLSIQSSGSVSL